MHATGVPTIDALAGARNLEYSAAPKESSVTLGRPNAIGQVLLTTVPLAAADLLAVGLSFYLASQLTLALAPTAVVEWAALAIALTMAVFLASAAVGLYPGVGLSTVAEARYSGMAAACICPIFLLVSLVESTRPVQFTIVVTCGLLLVALPLFRAVTRIVFSQFAWWGQTALIVGEGGSAAKLYSFLYRNPRFGVRPLGIVGDWTHRRATPRYLLGPLSRTAALVRELNAPWLIVAVPERGDHDVRAAVRHLARGGKYRTLVSQVDGSASLWRRTASCSDWLRSRDVCGQTPLLGLVKRVFDVSAALAGGLVLLPLILSICALIKLGSPGPIFFRQRRVGFGGREFIVWKFRTMICDGDRVLKSYLASHPLERAIWQRDHKLEHDPRVTFIGRWLRKFSLDELPQLFNVLRGEMSLVGPRPILPAEIPDFGDSFPAFCSVMPGITGLWQVCGRNGTTYAEHVELDEYYARNWSLWLDLYILVLTIKVVVLRDGAY